MKLDITLFAQGVGGGGLSSKACSFALDPGGEGLVITRKDAVGEIFCRNSERKMRTRKGLRDDQTISREENLCTYLYRYYGVSSVFELERQRDAQRLKTAIAIIGFENRALKSIMRN